jgi:hypothetical protein
MFMQEKRRRERTKSTPNPLRYRTEEILVAKNRNFSPLVLSFVYEPDNIALRELGTLIGTFIVSDTSEDSGYIVNCLAAAAKKEYFINSRRSVEESFESTLHKINLTLGKLVRDGHINWMGKLHGAIIAIRDHDAYFSVTGNAVILLLRDAILSDISEELSDPEAALHPLKTFTEISQGSILTNDKIILSTPELLQLLPQTLLEREASKLPLDRFAQLLKTALINECPAAATVLIDFFETPEQDVKNALQINRSLPSKEDTPSHPTFVENAFSSQSFRKNPPAATDIEIGRVSAKQPPLAQETPKEHVDTRTGHIYIQADTNSAPLEAASPFGESLSTIQEYGESFSAAMKKYRKRFMKMLSRWSASIFLASMSLMRRGSMLTLRFLVRNGRALIQKIRELGRATFSKGASIRNVSFPKNISRVPVAIPPSSISETPSSRPSKLNEYFFTILRFLRVTSQKMRPAFRIMQSLAQITTTKIRSLWRGYTAKQKIIVSILLASAILAGGGMLFARFTPQDTPAPELSLAPAPEPALSPFPPSDEPLAREISGDIVLSFADTDTPLIPIVLRDTLFVIGRNAIVNGETKTTLALPESAMPIRRAAAMQDLNAIFLYGQDQKMYLYYPNAKSLVENTFPIPSDFTITDMDTYLTYLYAFDAKQGRILRFPRAEGGFGAPTEWLKEKVTFDENAKMTIGENILIGSGNTIFSFTRGHGGAIPLTGTKTPIAIRDIVIDADGSFLILDTDNKRVAHLGKDGQLLGQYFKEELNDASIITTPTNGGDPFITLKEKIFTPNRH